MKSKKQNKAKFWGMISALSAIAGAISLAPSAHAAPGPPQLHCDASGHCNAVFDRNDAAARRLCSASTAVMVWKKGAATYLLQCTDDAGGGDNSNYLVTVSDAAVTKFSAIALDYGHYLPPSLLMAPAAVASGTAVSKAVSAATASATPKTPGAAAAANSAISGAATASVAPAISTSTKNVMLPFCSAVNPEKVKASDFVLMNRQPATGKNAYCYAPTYLSLRDGRLTIETANGQVQAGDSDYFGPSISPAARKDIQAMLREVLKWERH